jgi:hypothetical protein
MIVKEEYSSKIVTTNFKSFPSLKKKKKIKNNNNYKNEFISVVNRMILMFIDFQRYRYEYHNIFTGTFKLISAYQCFFKRTVLRYSIIIPYAVLIVRRNR